MLWETLNAVRDVGRLEEIVSTFIRYGFGDVVHRMGMAHVLEQAGKVLHAKTLNNFASLAPAVRLRRAFEDLGPTFIKLGQVLATRVDLLGPEWTTELGNLEDSAPAAPYAAILQQLTADLGGPPEEIFASFSSEPLAAGSIAQVHRARLTDGSEVAVKIRRPGIRPLIEADLRWMMRLAQLAETESQELRIFHPQEIVDQFAQSLRRELDLSVECRNAEHIAANFAAYSDSDSRNPEGTRQDTSSQVSSPIVIPRVYWQWTGERLCVEEFIDGISSRRPQDIEDAGLDRKVLARRGARAVLKMIFEDGFFHADPHAGNVLYLPQNRIALLDFGMVGTLTEERRDQLMNLMLGVLEREPKRVATVILDWTANPAIDEDDLTLEIQTFIDQYHGVVLKQLHLSAMLLEVVAILRRHHLTLPPDLALLIKVFITLEGSGRELDPDFNLVGEAMPALERAWQAHYAPAALAKRARRAAGETLSLFASLPHDISRLLRSARRGGITIQIETKNLRHVGNQLDRAVNRLVVGIVVAAFIIGSSLVVTVPGDPSLIGLHLFGLLGFLGAAIGGVWLLISIWRSSRADRE